MAFQPGNKHGKGRPTVAASLADAVRRKYPPEKVIELVEKHLASTDEKIAFAATQFIADRGYGKATEVVEMKTTLTDDEYREELSIVAREYIDQLDPEEKFKLLSNTAPSDNVQ